MKRVWHNAQVFALVAAGLLIASAAITTARSYAATDTILGSQWQCSRILFVTTCRVHVYRERAPEPLRDGRDLCRCCGAAEEMLATTTEVLSFIPHSPSVGRHHAIWSAGFFDFFSS